MVYLPVLGERFDSTSKHCKKSLGQLSDYQLNYLKSKVVKLLKYTNFYICHWRQYLKNLSVAPKAFICFA